MAQESMFWEIASEDVLEASDKNVSADHKREWRIKKDRMETKGDRARTIRVTELARLVEKFKASRQVERDLC